MLQNAPWPALEERLRIRPPAGVESTEPRQSPSPLEELPALTLEEESEVVTWVLEELRAGRPLDMLEVYLVVRSLMAAMQVGGMFLVPLVRLRDFDQYTTVHSINVAVLSMALAEFLGLDSLLVSGPCPCDFGPGRHLDRGTWSGVSLVNSSIVTSGNHEFTMPSATGDYVYYCTVHGTPTSGMRGTVRVQ